MNDEKKYCPLSYIHHQGNIVQCTNECAWYDSQEGAWKHCGLLSILAYIGTDLEDLDQTLKR